MDKVVIFHEDSSAIRYLTTVDEEMASLISRVGNYTLKLHINYFEALIYSIIGQQLSAKVAIVLRQRVMELCSGYITPQAILDCSDEALRAKGISTAKSVYLKNVARSVLAGDINFELFVKMTDQEVIQELTKIKGIGQWTAEMFLIFSLGRLDILSMADVGLQRAIKWLYKLDSAPNAFTLKELREVWSPYCTVASLYLWEVINQDYISQ